LSLRLVTNSRLVGPPHQSRSAGSISPPFVSARAAAPRWKIRSRRQICMRPLTSCRRMPSHLLERRPNIESCSPPLDSEQRNSPLPLVGVGHTRDNNDVGGRDRGPRRRCFASYVPPARHRSSGDDTHPPIMPGERRFHRRPHSRASSTSLRSSMATNSGLSPPLPPDVATDAIESMGGLDTSRPRGGRGTTAMPPAVRLCPGRSERLPPEASCRHVGGA
jgi:hypothetical protein